EVATSKARISKGAAQHYISELFLAKGIEEAATGNSADANQSFLSAIAYADKVTAKHALVNSRFGTRKAETEVYFGNGLLLETSEVIDTAQTNYYWDLFQEGNQNHAENTESIWIASVDYGSYNALDKSALLLHPRYYGAVFRANSVGHWDSNSTNEDVGGRGITNITPTFYTRDHVYAGVWADDMRNSHIVFRRNIKGNKP